MSDIQRILPKSFDRENHWYEKALNATIHPMVSFFLHMKAEQIVKRYCHLHPLVRPAQLDDLLNFKPKHFFWSGADLINVTSAGAKRQMVVIETNSCPSGQKSMPLKDEQQEMGGYLELMRHTFAPLVNVRRQATGRLAVIYDKNPMEATGYAAAMAEVFQEEVLLVPFPSESLEDPNVRVSDGTLQCKDEEGFWQDLRACFRYLTQKPWNRLPVSSKTFIFNPVIACLAGGRNKMVAAKAYELLNGELQGSGLAINTPETIWDVSKDEVPLWVNKLGGQAVIKVPYSNAGQGVFTIVSRAELDAFMALDFHYEKFIVQSLIGNYNWSSQTAKGKLYHVGTLPDKRNNTYVSDLRMMIHNTEHGFRPLSIYARRAALPLLDKIPEGEASWSILGTNLSYKTPEGAWSSDTSRLMMMDQRDFNKLGIGLDDLIEAYIQTLLSTVAIDKMAQNLISIKGRLKSKLFRSLNNDEKLIEEILKSK